MEKSNKSERMKSFINANRREERKERKELYVRGKWEKISRVPSQETKRWMEREREGQNRI